jgi:hypothetical protein
MFGRKGPESKYSHHKTGFGLTTTGETSVDVVCNARADDAVRRFGKAIDRRIKQQKETIHDLVNQGKMAEVARVMVAAIRQKQEVEQTLRHATDEERRAYEQELAFREVEHDLEREALGYLAENVYKGSIEALNRGTWERVPQARLADFLRTKKVKRGMFTMLRLVQQSNYQSFLTRNMNEVFTYQEYVDIQTLPLSELDPMSELLRYSRREWGVMKIQDDGYWRTVDKNNKSSAENQERYSYYIIDSSRAIDEQMPDIQSIFSAQQEDECVEKLMRPWGLVPLSFLKKQPENSAVLGRINYVTDGSTTWQVKTADYISQGLVAAFTRFVNDKEKIDRIVRDTNQLDADLRGSSQKKLVITHAKYYIVSTKAEIEHIFESIRD